jgi:hypothetical protein
MNVAMLLTLLLAIFSAKVMLTKEPLQFSQLFKNRFELATIILNSRSLSYFFKMV